jgi:hypothetical protein
MIALAELKETVMSIPVPILQVAVPAMAIAAVMALFPVGLALIVLIGLILVGGLARGVARSSEHGRWIATGIYTGALMGFVIALMRGVE